MRSQAVIELVAVVGTDDATTARQGQRLDHHRKWHPGGAARADVPQTAHFELRHRQPGRGQARSGEVLASGVTTGMDGVTAQSQVGGYRGSQFHGTVVGGNHSVHCGMRQPCEDLPASCSGVVEIHLQAGSDRLDQGVLAVRGDQHVETQRRGGLQVGGDSVAVAGRQQQDALPGGHGRSRWGSAPGSVGPGGCLSNWLHRRHRSRRTCRHRPPLGTRS